MNVGIEVSVSYTPWSLHVSNVGPVRREEVLAASGRYGSDTSRRRGGEEDIRREQHPGEAAPQRG